MPEVTKILIAAGTRPELNKLAPVYLGLKQKANTFDVRLLITGQHRSMLDQMLNTFNLIPDYDLDIMRPDQDLFYVSTSIMENIKAVLNDFSPDCVLVQGDTTTTFISALSAFYNKTFLGHVEAGLRTFDKYSPFPEEVNRRMVSCLADIHFAPTVQASKNLEAEGIAKADILITGNTSIDSLFWVLENTNPLSEDSNKRLLPIIQQPFILVTCHRRESFGKPVVDIMSAISRIAKDFSNTNILFPVHPNPQVQTVVREHLADHPNVYLIEPLDYACFAHLIQKCLFVLTDSGGIQEEAPALGKPVIVLREKTERPEGVEAGTAVLAGTDSDRIYDLAQRLLRDQDFYNSMAKAVNPYGDGHASERIVEYLENCFLKSS